MAESKTLASNKKLTRRRKKVARVGSNGGVSARRIFDYQGLFNALVNTIYSMAHSTPTPWLYVTTSDVARTINVTGKKNTPPFVRRILLAALLKIEREFGVDGVGTYYANDRVYVILDGRRLRSMTIEEMAREFTRIILEGDEP